MATLRDVRRRIVGVKKTQKITKAMKMVAAAKLRRAQAGVLSARPYAERIKDLASHVSTLNDEAPGALLQVRDVKNVALVVVTADRGLCGAFNSNLAKAAVDHVARSYPGLFERGNLRVFCIGRKGSDFFSKRRFPIAGKYIGVYAALTFPRAREIASVLINGFTAGEFDRVDIIYNEFKSVRQQRIVVEQFLPLTHDAASGEGANRPAVRPVTYIEEPSGRAIRDAIIPKRLIFQVWRILLESNAAEQGARMVAMDNATENADEMIGVLQLQYNKARQASITKELLEVVSGAEALSRTD